MFWGKRKGSVCQHICLDQATTLCNSKVIADHVIKDWDFTRSKYEFDDRRICIRCLGVMVRSYDNKYVFSWARKALNNSHLRAVS